MGVADVSGCARAVCTYSDRPRCRSSGDASHHEIVGTDQHRAFNLAEAHARAAQLVWTQTFSDDANLASGQSEIRRDRLDVRLAVNVLFSQQTVGNTHRFVPAGASPTTLEVQSATEDA